MRTISFLVALTGLCLNTFASTSDPVISENITAKTATAESNTKPISNKEKGSEISSARENGVAVNIPCINLSPCAIVADTTRKVLGAVNQGVSPKETKHLIYNIVVPQFEFVIMTRYALGSNWKTATKAQQTQLVELFKQLLVYTYSSALTRFKGAKIDITSSDITNRKAIVVSQVYLPNNNNNDNHPVKVEYDLANVNKSGMGIWKAYDIKIENASLVTTYRNQFNDIIQSNHIEGLILQLKTKIAGLQKGQ